MPTVAQGVTLTIEPGVVVQFEPNSRLTVAGTISAVGTLTRPITFTGVVQSSGSWQGLTIQGSPTALNTGSVLSYVTVEYGGTASANAANLTLWYAQASILHSTFRYGARHGLYATGNDALANISDSSFLDNGPANGGYAVVFQDGGVKPALARLSAARNGVDAVSLGGHAYLEGENVWAQMGLPYVITGGLTVPEDARLTIEPGVEVRFERFQGLEVRGRLDALGLPTQPIIFTGTMQSPGWWGSIAVTGTLAAPATTRFEYVTIEYGGSSSANLYISNGQVAIHHGTLRFSGRHGVRANGGTRVAIEASHIVSNTDYGVYNGSTAETDIIETAAATRAPTVVA
jgi:hypothetical protein